jgi:hypothetical protein
LIKETKVKIERRNSKYQNMPLAAIQFFTHFDVVPPFFNCLKTKAALLNPVRLYKNQGPPFLALKVPLFRLQVDADDVLPEVLNRQRFSQDVRTSPPCPLENTGGGGFSR